MFKCIRAIQLDYNPSAKKFFVRIKTSHICICIYHIANMDRADKVFDVENWCHWCAKITNPVQIIEWKCGNHTYLDIDERERERERKSEKQTK